jgi:hypothetical protein
VGAASLKGFPPAALLRAVRGEDSGWRVGPPNTFTKAVVGILAPCASRNRRRNLGRARRRRNFLRLRRRHDVRTRRGNARRPIGLGGFRRRRRMSWIRDDVRVRRRRRLFRIGRHVASLSSRRFSGMPRGRDCSTRGRQPLVSNGTSSVPRPRRREIDFVQEERDRNDEGGKQRERCEDVDIGEIGRLVQKGRADPSGGLMLGVA